MNGQIADKFQAKRFELVKTNQYNDFHSFEGVRHENNFGWSDIGTNLSQGWDNLTTALGGHPIDALTQSAIQKATADAKNAAAKIAGRPLTESESKAIEDKITSTVTVEKVQTKVGENISTGLANLFSGFKWIIIAVVVVAATIAFVELKKAL